MASSTLVFAIIVVGGVTRLTESGLSITEWRPITGILPPLSADDWEEEFTKYKATPEFKLLNHSISIDDFKSIFYMEWGHRVLGRLLGLAFVGPLAYFAMTKKISRPLAGNLAIMAGLIGAQGLLGWYMVKSGLDDALMEQPGAIPRVSQYRLAAHLGMAVLLYAGMFTTGLSIIKEWKFAHALGDIWNGMPLKTAVGLVNNPIAMRLKLYAQILTGMVFLTAMSGAFVAGLDAGLLYNEFPLMGGRLAPPVDEMFSSAYAKGKGTFEVWWRNMFENPTTVQFNHRVLAITTYCGVGALYALTFRPGCPPGIRRLAGAAFAMANVQAALGISTLLYLVPVPLAACHQAGSIMLLSAVLHLLLYFRRPSQAAQLWKQYLKKVSSN